MNNYCTAILAVTILLATSSCGDMFKEKEASGSAKMAFTDAQVAAFAADTTGILLLNAIDSMFTPAQRDLIKIPYVEIDSINAKQWIRNYDSLSTPQIGHDSLVKRIWLSDNMLARVVAKARTAKLFVALDTTGANRKLTVLLQIKLKLKDEFQYFDLDQPKNMYKFSPDGAFCPPPYPCSSDSIWAFKTEE